MLKSQVSKKKKRRATEVTIKISVNNEKPSEKESV